MELNVFDDERRGQVGIGTLIVFIAMVLVAAIAAGVLINTAGFLQTQAEDTGESSTQQVADSLNMITEVGEVGDDSANNGGGNDQIAKLQVGVQPAAGADDINLAKLTVQYVSDGEFANLVVGARGDGSGNDQATGDSDPSNIVVDDSTQENYVIDVITAENNGDIVMTDSSDRYEIVIPLVENDGFDSVDSNSDVGGLAPLDEGEEVELTVTTEVGAQTVAFLQVPDSLSGDDPGTTVNL